MFLSACNKPRDRISGLLSIIFEAIMVGYFKVHTGIFTLLNSLETMSITDDVSSTRSKGLFLLFPVTALVVNLGVKIYSMKLLWMPDVVIHKNDEVASKGQPFASPMNGVLVVSGTVVYSLITSFADRTSRLLFYFPLHFTILLIGVPAFAIYKSHPMKLYFEENYFKPIMDTFSLCLSKLQFQTRSNAVIPIIE